MDFRLDESRPQINNLPNPLYFDGVLTCGLIQDKTDPIHEPFPPGTRMYIQHNDVLDRGTIKNIPISVSPILKCATSPSPDQSDDGSISTELPESSQYVILRESGTTVEKSYDDIIHAGWDDASPYKSTNNVDTIEGITHFLRNDYKATMDHKGSFHKGYINYPPEFVFQFIVIRN